MDESSKSDTDIARMESWVEAANAWGEAAQTLVGAAADLTLASRSLADTLEPESVDRVTPDLHSKALGDSLRALGDEVEDDSEALRDRYLATAANLADYREILD